MLRWSVLFAITIGAGILGFAGIAGAATGFAKLIFIILLSLLVVNIARYMVKNQ